MDSSQDIDARIYRSQDPRFSRQGSVNRNSSPRYSTAGIERKSLVQEYVYPNSISRQSSPDIGRQSSRQIKSHLESARQSLIQRSSQDNGGENLMQRSSLNSAHQSLAYRSSQDNEDGSLIMKRPSQDSRGRSLSVQRSSQDNRDGSLMVQRPSQENGDERPMQRFSLNSAHQSFGQRSSQDNGDGNLIMQRPFQENGDESSMQRFSLNSVRQNLGQRSSEDNGDGSLIIQRSSQDNGDESSMQRFSLNSARQSFGQRSSEDNGDGNLIMQRSSQENGDESSMQRFSLNSSRQSLGQRSSQDYGDGSLIMQRPSQENGDEGSMQWFSLNSSRQSLGQRGSQDNGDGSLMQRSSQGNGEQQFSLDSGRQSLMQKPSEEGAYQSLMQTSSDERARQSLMQRSSQDNGDDRLMQRFSLDNGYQSLMRRSSQDNEDETWMEQFSQNNGYQSLMRRSSQDNEDETWMEQFSQNNGDESLMQQFSQDYGDERMMQRFSSGSGFQNVIQRPSQMSGRQSLMQPSSYQENEPQSLVSPESGGQSLRLASSSSYQDNGRQSLVSSEGGLQSFRQQSSQESARQSMRDPTYEDSGYLNLMQRSSLEGQFNIENESQSSMQGSSQDSGRQSLMRKSSQESEHLSSMQQEPRYSSQMSRKKSLARQDSNYPRLSSRPSSLESQGLSFQQDSKPPRVSSLEIDRQSLGREEFIPLDSSVFDKSDSKTLSQRGFSNSNTSRQSLETRRRESYNSNTEDTEFGQDDEDSIYSSSLGRLSFQQNSTRGNDYKEAENEGLVYTTSDLQSSRHSFEGEDHGETPVYMERGSFLNENRKEYNQQYADGSPEKHHDESRGLCLEDLDESKVGEQQCEVLPNEKSTPFGSGRKSLVQDFIYPTSRNSFRKSISPTDEGADQRTAIPDITNHRRSSLRLFSRLSINNAENDLTKLQSQELMYSPSFSRVSSKQEFELETSKTNLQTIPQRPDEPDFLALGRKSFQKNVRHEHDQGEIHPEDFSFLDSAAKSNDQVLEEENKEDMQAYMELEYGAPSHEGPGDKISIEEYAGRSSGVKRQHKLNDTNLVENQGSMHSSSFAKGHFETDFEMESDGNDDEGMEEEEDIEYRPSAASAGEIYDEEDLDGSLEESQEDDASGQDFEDNDGPSGGECDNQLEHKVQSKSFINLEGTMGSFKRGFGSSRSFIKVPFGASELSYEGFAKAHFIEPSAGIWPILWKTVAIQDLIRFSKDLLTQPLLQRLAAAPHKQYAVFAFTHLLAYMGDIPTVQDVIYHIQQILMLGITCSDLRDEIFCQICKQTTANPSRWSNSRGWQAMALCVGTFAPSSTFRPFLEAHLEQVAGHFVGEWAGDTMSYQEEGMSNPSKAAEYCLTRLHKLLQAGARRIPPLHVEINAVEKMESVRVNMYLPDDTFKVLNLDPMATAGEVTEQLAQMNGLSDPKYYGIFQVLYADVMVEKVLTRNSYIMEVLSEWNRASLPPLEADTRLIAKAKRIFEKHLLCLPNRNMMMLENHQINSGLPVQMDPSRTEMLFKRKIFIEDLSVLPEDVQKAVENFDYVQTVRDVVYGVYPLEEHDAVMLGALQLRADSGFFKNLDDALTDEIIRKFGPKIYVEGSEREWKTALVRTAAALPPEADMSNCISDYIDFLRSRCNLYGSSWYYVQQRADPRLPHEMFVCINTAGVYFVKVKTKEQLLHMQFTEICSWGYAAFSFSLVTGNMTYSHDHRLITTQGAEIGETLQMYINRLQF